MRFPPLLQTASIVIVGNFNPSIFSPAWFRLQEVISDEELAIAEKNTSVIHPEIAEFTIDTMSIQVTPFRMMIRTSELPFIKIADIMTTVFGNLLTHTPVQKLGINLEMHFSVESAKRRVALGRVLAPIEPWGDWGKELQTNGGLRVLAMEQWDLPSRKSGSYRRVQIEPSMLAAPPRPNDVFVSVNDHYELGVTPDTTPFVTTLRDFFDTSIDLSSKIISDLMEYSLRLG